jgi:transposase
MQRRKFSREFKLEAVRLVKERGVAVAQAARDLDVHENVLRKWVREFAADKQDAFPGHGQMKAEQQEIQRLRREVAKLKAERDILKKPRPTSRRTRYEVYLHRETPRGLAGIVALRGARCLAQWVSCLAGACPIGTRQKRQRGAQGQGKLHAE